MKYEYEIKSIAKNRNELLKRIRALGAKRMHNNRLMTRIIFENQKTKKDRSWLRLRDEGDKITLTLKQALSNTKIDGVKEAEIIVDDLYNTKHILSGIGLVIKRYQENYREKWALGDIIFDIDQWPELPLIIEIEGPSEDAVKTVVAKLGFKYEEGRFGSIDVIYKELLGRDILSEKELTFN